ncbi:MAG: thioredoxin family protein [Chloroflexi bacterium]|nr:thioredoxin family protein [Chloroflexota bacterium]
MAIISTADQETLRDRFDREIQGDVTILHFTKAPSRLLIPGRQPDSPYLQQTEQLLRELAALSEHITLEVYDVREEPEVAERWGIERVPATIVVGPPEGRLRFFGIPAGYEFAAFVDDLIDAANGQSRLSEASQETLRGLEGDAHVQVFVTPT